jgi:hypothetical protein
VTDVRCDGIDARDATLAVENSSTTSAYFENSPGSVFEGSSASSVRLVGDVNGVTLSNDSVVLRGSGSLVGLSIEGCTGELSLYGSSISVVLTTAPAGSSAVAVHVDGSCHAIIDSSTISSTGGDAIDTVALECAAPCSVLASSVTVSKWTDNFNYRQWDPYPARGEVLGLACDGCEEVSRNTISTAVPQPPFYNIPGNYTVTAAAINGTGTGARLENNIIVSGCSDGLFKSYLQHGIALIAGAGADVDSNALLSVTPGNVDSGRGLSSGLQVRGAAAVRNNIIVGSPYALDGISSVTENNDIDGWAFVFGPTSDADALNGYPGCAENFFGHCAASGNHLTLHSACVNAGTPVGAPALDFDGEARDASPDVGPDEWSAANDVCTGITCGGHGQCGVVNTSCTCDPGYVILDEPNVCKPAPAP